MIRHALNSLLVRLSVCILVGGVLSGCVTPKSVTSRYDLMRQHFGIRPDEPLVQVDIPPGRNCDEYRRYVTYSQQLMEAYHSRATQNRGWIYIAGITGLGVTAASGGLAAAAAVSVGTLGLLSISGGFAAGTFAIISNQDLAITYTIAANRVDTALKESERLRLCADCTAALVHLKESVSAARVKLEESRTNNTIGALDRAKEADKVLRDLIKGVEKAQSEAASKTGASSTDLAKDQPADVTLTCRITATPAALSIDPANDKEIEVTLTGGKPAYTWVSTSSPKHVMPTLKKDTTDTFIIKVEKEAEEGKVVFVDSSQPPLNVMVPVTKKTQ